jgi:hypothetical protein
MNGNSGQNCVEVTLNANFNTAKMSFGRFNGPGSAFGHQQVWRRLAFGKWRAVRARRKCRVISEQR